MREIKFRAWNKIAKYFIPWWNIISFTQDEWLLRKDIEIMQYTWLKDNNLKEIYDWDIIEYENVKDDEIEIWQVRWCDDDTTWWVFWQLYKIWGDKDWVNLKPYQMTVIWNIYENPELLNK